MARTRLDRAIRSYSQPLFFAFTGLVVAATAATLASTFFSSSSSTGGAKDQSGSSLKDSLYSAKTKKDIPPEQQFVESDEEREREEKELLEESNKSAQDDDSQFDNKANDPNLWTDDKLESWLRKVCFLLIFIRVSSYTDIRPNLLAIRHCASQRYPRPTNQFGHSYEILGYPCVNMLIGYFFCPFTYIYNEF